MVVNSDGLCQLCVINFIFETHLDREKKPMLLSKIEDLIESEERAIIINCGTKELSTLALMSALRYADMPILLIDCESNDGSLEHFSALTKDYDFDLLSAPLQGHGITLDWLFKKIKAKKTLLIDSDLEILNHSIIGFIKDYIDDERIFGCGFVHGPLWMDSSSLTGTLYDGAYYQERPWIPLTFLKTSHISAALDAGYSFKGGFIYNDFNLSNKFSRTIAELRLKLPAFKKFKLPSLFRDSYNGSKPSLVYCDTGAAIYQYLKHNKKLDFVGLPARIHERFCTHLDGSTRKKIFNANDSDKSSISSVENHAKDRLLKTYGISM